mmetsp:Transcript_52552/g.137842  ORF Transcript_52552/g.137842 Transcript_52552/m.137842 type:complete len:326 (-) Transcript_52552:639-1616(-)
MLKASYGAINLPETKREQRNARNRLSFLAISSLSVCTVLLIGFWVSNREKQESELVFYEHKYTELDPYTGGDWNICLRCRKESAECQSPDPGDPRFNSRPYNTWGFTLPSKDAMTNACPPRKGMVTVRVRRNGIVRTEWFDKDKLMASGAGIEPPEPFPAGPPPSNYSGVVMCIAAPPGDKNKTWHDANNCTPVQDWLVAAVAKAGAEEDKALEKAVKVLPPEEQPDDSDFDSEVPKVVKTPISDWFNGLVQEIYDKSYKSPPAAAPPAAAAAAAPEKPEEVDPDTVSPVNPRMEVPADDCYGPPSLGCQVDSLRFPFFLTFRRP